MRRALQRMIRISRKQYEFDGRVFRAKGVPRCAGFSGQMIANLMLYLAQGWELQRKFVRTVMEALPLFVVEGVLWLAV